MLNTYSTDKIPLRVHGRTDGRKCPVPLFWSGSCVEVNVSGSQLFVEYECEFASGECYIRIEIDGADMYRLMLNEGRHTLMVFNGFPESDVKNVRIYRENQAGNTSLAIYSFTTDGKFYDVTKRKLIEFFGDSITSGEGLSGAQCLNSWIPAVFSNRGSYAVEIAKALDYDYSIVSQSGWGVYCSWNNNPMSNIPSLYDYVCDVANTPAQIKLGAKERFCFERKPNITVVFLGGNDSGAFNSQAWTDGDGVSHKLNKDPNGKPVKQDIDKVANAMCAFLKKIRANQPDTLILWCYYSLENLTKAFYDEAISAYAKETGDKNVFFVELPKCDAALNGSRNHPGALAHKIYAEAILNKLYELGISDKL